MKAVVALALASLLVFSGCGSSVQAEKLPGTWQLKRQEAYFKSKTGESRTEKEVPTEDSFLYVFDQGKMYIPGKNSQAVYQASYRQDGDKLQINGNDKSAYEFKIEELNDDTLKLEKKTEQGEIEDRIVLTFQRIGGLNNSGVVNRPNENYGAPQQPYNAAPGNRVSAPVTQGNSNPPRL